MSANGKDLTTYEGEDRTLVVELAQYSIPHNGSTHRMLFTLHSPIATYIRADRQTCRRREASIHLRNPANPLS